MANIHKPDENIKTDVATVLVTLTGGASPALYFSMQNYDLAWFIVHCHTNAASAGTLSCAMQEQIGAAGGGIQLLKAAATLVTAGTLDVSLFARGEDLTVNSGYTHIGIIITEGNTQPVTVSAVLCRLRARYKQAILLA
ncbi:unnamed protein product [marine sediment metagenome]|uniref:Uncharacterized protein n=1 Tax=marine sediment metagenome TaxID=412755 RepID=X0TMU6_9ZZZZ